MSIYPVSKSSPESARSQSIEIDGENVPEKHIEGARSAAERFFEQELPDTKRETRDWAIEVMLPAMVQAEKERTAVSESEVALFLEGVSERIGPMIDELGKVNFSRGHELDRHIFPSVQDFKPIASWLNSLKGKYELYKKQNSFISEFQKTFQPFFDMLLKTVRERALTSRKLQYEQILANPKDQEFEFNKAVTYHHIYDLENKPTQPLAELQSLLNLGRHPKIDRVPSMEEQEAFRFLLTISEFKKS